MREVLAEHASKRRHRSAGNHQKQTPAVKKSGRAAESVADVAIKTARLRIACCQLCVGKCSQKRQDATHNPYEHGDTHRASHLAENGARRAKDAGANDRANE